MALKTAKTPSTAKRKITLTRVFDAPLKTVWKAWTDPKELAKWWGPVDWTTPVCELDLRPGGSIRIVMAGPGAPRHPMGGTFREIVPNKRLVFENWPEDDKGSRLAEGVATVTFEPVGSKTRLTLEATAIAIAPVARQMLSGMNAGWSQSLLKLDSLVTDSLDREIVVTRCINAPRERVWEAWTDPKQVVHWWGPKGFTSTIETMDVRVGGRWKLVMHGPDGKDYPNASVFREVVKPERLVFRHGGGRKGEPGATFMATWTFEPMGDQTILTMRGVFASAKERDLVVKNYNALEGGRQTLARLDDYLSGRKA